MKIFLDTSKSQINCLVDTHLNMELTHISYLSGGTNKMFHDDIHCHP